jgi:hypothetical protein
LVQFEEARELVWEQKLATKEKWQEWCDRLRSPRDNTGYFKG